MPKINVVLPTGGVVSVDEDAPGIAQLEQTNQLPTESVGAEAERQRREDLDSWAGGTAGALGEGIVSAADTLTLGGFGKAADALGLGDVEEGLAEAHPDARTAGAVAAMLLPTGIAGQFAKDAALEASGLGLASHAGDAVGNLLGGGVLGSAGRLATEGAIFGAGAHVADTNATGDPLTVEGLLEAAGTGAFLNAGAGAVLRAAGEGFNRFVAATPEEMAAAKELEANSAASRTAQEAAEAAAAQHELDEATAAPLRATLANPPSSWDDLRAEWQADVKETDEYNRQQAAAEKKWSDFYSTGKLEDAANRAQSVISQIRGRWAPEELPVQRTTVVGPEGIKGSTARVVDDADNAVEVKLNASGEPIGVRVKDTGTAGKAPISPEMTARLDEFQARISGILKKARGGWAQNAGGRWIRDAGQFANPSGALEDLRNLQDEMRRQFPSASARLRELPPQPTPPRPEVGPAARTLPRNLRDFARKSVESVGDIANGMGPRFTDTVNRFASDLGLEAAATPGETLAGIHRKLGEFNQAIDKADASAEMAKQAARTAKASATKLKGTPLPSSKRPILVRMANNGVRLAASRAVDIGGFMGAMARSATATAVGSALNSVEDAVLGRADAEMLAHRTSLRTKLRELIDKYIKGIRAVGRGLPPVVTNLGVSFLTGQRDSRGSIAENAARRVAEIRSAARTAPDVLYTAVQPLMGHPSLIASKLSATVQNTMTHLVSKLPTDPGIDFSLAGSNWVPTTEQSIELAHRIEAVNNPIRAAARLLAGDGHPGGAETLQAVWPALSGELQSELQLSGARLAGKSPSETRGLSMLLGVPTSGFDHPDVTLALQGMYAQSVTWSPPSAQQPAESRGPGRPPKVINPVAGSNVSALINQQ